RYPLHCSPPASLALRPVSPSPQALSSHARQGLRVGRQGEANGGRGMPRGKAGGSAFVVFQVVLIPTIVDILMTTRTKPHRLPGITPGTKPLGEINPWTCGGIKVRHLDLVNALRAAELDETVARELPPRHAFTRACKKLSEARIIRQ